MVVELELALIERKQSQGTNPSYARKLRKGSKVCQGQNSCKAKTVDKTQSKDL